ncbi:MAG: hypothetical protein ACK53Y_18850, partial [bacterium]
YQKLKELPKPLSYRIIFADINIYWRGIRILYKNINDNSEYINLFENHVFFLGWWHPYKELCLKIWKYYSFLFGPMFNILFPHKKIMEKPKLYQLEQFYTWFSIMYSDKAFQNTFQDYFALSELCKSKIHIYFQNIHLLFTYYLPLSTDYC